jgi:hypothetical protein
MEPVSALDPFLDDIRESLAHLMGSRQGDSYLCRVSLDFVDEAVMPHVPRHMERNYTISCSDYDPAQRRETRGVNPQSSEVAKESS